MRCTNPALLTAYASAMIACRSSGVVRFRVEFGNGPMAPELYHLIISAH
jgi:hypothetical protein